MAYFLGHPVYTFVLVLLTDVYRVSRTVLVYLYVTRTTGRFDILFRSLSLFLLSMKTASKYHVKC